MNAAIVIPARLGSTRLPRKLLLDLAGKTVLQRTFEQATRARLAKRIVIATDSEEIAAAAKAFGAETRMTRADHQSGTERVAEAAAALDVGTIVNIQGDEPEIDPAHIDALIEAHEAAGLFATTLACPFPADIDPATRSAVKAVLGRTLDGARKIYEGKDFTRSPPLDSDPFLHIGVYAFGRESLMRFAAAPASRRERAENLEQLRILDMGERIAVRLVGEAVRGINTEDELNAARRRLDPRSRK